MDGIIHAEKGVGKWELGVFRFFPPPTKDERRINEGSTKDDAAEIGEFVGLTFGFVGLISKFVGLTCGFVGEIYAKSGFGFEGIWARLAIRTGINRYQQQNH